MKFSVVITTYNRVDLLRRAVDSALSQSIPCEVVIADNASTDGTEAFVRSLGDRVIYQRNEENLHHAGAVNAGVERATGDWVKLVDDDDYLAPHCLQVMAEAITQHPKAAICSCRAAQVDGQGQELSRTASVGPGKVCYIPQIAIHYGMFLEQVPFGTPIQVAVRREAFLKSGGWDLTMTSCDDIDSWIRIADFGDALFINDILAYRTVWPGGYDQKIDLRQRMETNSLIKERIYAHVSPLYQGQLPNLNTMRRYLQLHWGFVALKQRHLPQALILLAPAVFSWPAWKLLRQAQAHRTQQTQSEMIPKVMLTP